MLSEARQQPESSVSESGTSGSLGGEMMAQSNSLLCGYGHYKFMSTLILVLKATYILFISIRQRNNIYKNILGAASVTWAPCKQLITVSFSKEIELNLTLWFTLLFSRDLTNIVTPFYLSYHPCLCC